MPTRAEYRDPVKRKAWAEQYYLASRDARDAAGLCRVCGAAAREAGKTRCSGCIAAVREKNRLYQRQRFARGQCASCTEQAVPGKVHCPRCAESSRARIAAERSSLEAKIFGLIRRAKQRANRRGIPFDITVSDLQPLPLVCPVLGLLLKFNAGRMAHDSPSLDRIKGELGYVRGNVRVISARANRLRSNGTADELEAVARYARSLEGKG